MKVIVIGGGAAGMIAAIAAARSGGEVVLLEKNEKTGKKLYITGKGRCNLTNACELEDFFGNVVTNRNFLYHSLYGFTNNDMMQLMRELGCPVKIERGGRVFPVSDKSSDVLSVLQRELSRRNVDVRLRCPVRAVHCGGGRFRSVELPGGELLAGDSCIVATGGLSYPSTGSTGDGYRFARSAGHEVTELFPSLVPFDIKEREQCQAMQGLSVRNVRCRITADGKKKFDEFGELLFTHFGVSGPLILRGSAYLSSCFGKNIRLHINLKPAMTEAQLDQRLLRDFAANSNKAFQNSLGALLPRKMIPVVVRRSRIPPEKKTNLVTKEERRRLLETITDFTLTVEGLRGYPEAIVTKGGVRLNQIDPSSMESKLVSGLYFAGEILDVDALTGGYNLQIAWSTGYSAGIHAAAEQEKEN